MFYIKENLFLEFHAIIRKIKYTKKKIFLEII